MAFTCVTEGMEDLLQGMEQLGNAGQGAAAAGLYEAAGVYADAVSRAVNGIAVEPFKYAVVYETTELLEGLRYDGEIESLM